MKFQKTIIFAMVCLALTACKNDKEQTPEIVTVDTSSTAKKNEDYKVPEISATFKDPKIAEVYAQYGMLQNALVHTNSADAKHEATVLQTMLRQLTTVAPQTITAIDAIVSTTEVEEQRKAFVAVTKGIELLLEGQLTSGTIYKVHCPMAFNNTGASWLSAEKIVQNPYFGDRMLKCGRIEATIE